MASFNALTLKAATKAVASGELERVGQTSHSFKLSAAEVKRRREKELRAMGISIGIGAGSGSSRVDRQSSDRVSIFLLNLSSYNAYYHYAFTLMHAPAGGD